MARPSDRLFEITRTTTFNVVEMGCLTGNLGTNSFSTRSPDFQKVMGKARTLWCSVQRVHVVALHEDSVIQEEVDA